MAESDEAPSNGSVTLPPPGEDIMSSSQLWPTPTEGLFGLETAILHGRLNTLCAMLQEVRSGIAEVLDAIKSPSSEPLQTKRKKVASDSKSNTKKPKSKVTASVSTCIDDLHKLLVPHEFSREDCVKLVRASLAWQDEDPEHHKLFPAGGPGRNVKAATQAWVEAFQDSWPTVAQIYKYRVSAANNVHFHVAKAVGASRNDKEGDVSTKQSSTMTEVDEDNGSDVEANASDMELDGPTMVDGQTTA